MTGWLADLFRHVWALFYWNWAKTRFRLNRARRCPCQAPSDSGKALETHCEACLDWHEPERFRRVCPLLRRTPEGLMCSADTADVRPFWGLAARQVLGTLLAVYLALVLSAFAGLRLLGYPVSVVNLAWPGRWHRLNEARAQYYYQKGAEAFAGGDLRAASMSLFLSYQLDPRRYEVGMMLAEIATLAMPDRADPLYASLMAGHPDQAQRTARVWMRSALERGSFAALRNLALSRLQAGDEPAAPWLHALLESTRALHDDGALSAFAATPKGTPWRRILETELLIRQGQAGRAVDSLNEAWYPIDPYKAYYQTRELLALGHPREALIMLTAYQSAMPGEEQAAVRLAAVKLGTTQAQWLDQARGFLERTPLTAAALELYSEHLVRYPDSDFLALLLPIVDKRPLPMNDASLQAYLALYCAAGACGDRPAVERVGALLRTRSSNRFYFLETVRTYFLDPASRTRLQDFLPLMPLSLEMIYDLWERDLRLAASRTDTGTTGGPGGAAKNLRLRDQPEAP